MNPSRLYEPHREDALAKQIAETKYSIFVAMPFRDTFSYRSQEIYKEIIQKAAEIANARQTARRAFDVPRRVDDAPGQAVVITEEIVIGILESHFFLADVTFQNPGVILETGIALGLKPNRQIILISQGTPEELHFDLRNNSVIFYRDSSAVEKLADAIIAAAAAFEEDADKYVHSVIKGLSETAIQCLLSQGEEMKKETGQRSLHSGRASEVFKNCSSGEASLLFQAATQELIQRKLFEMHFYKDKNGDKRGMYPTKLGSVVIKKWWPEFFKPQT